MRSHLLAPALLPVLLISCGPAGPDSRGHRAAFPDLHTRLVRTQATALDGEALHEHLSHAAVGEALTRAYLQAAEAGRRRRAAGAAVQIEEVRYADVEVLARGPQGSQLHAAWIVTGTVRHGDHTHRRATRYAGLYRVVDTRAGPRIAEERAGDSARLLAPPPAGTGDTTALDLLEASP